MSFWTDIKVVEDFEPADKLVFLYLMTNPHTNLSGCYEIGMSQMVLETGYPKDKVKKIIDRLEKTLKVIRYDANTREILIINWYKHNWTDSEKFRKPLLKEINEIKNDQFRQYLLDRFKGIDTVSIRYGYGMDMVLNQVGMGMDTTVTVTDTDTVSVTDSDSVSVPEEEQEVKHKYGQYSHVRLTDKDIATLNKKYGEDNTKAAIEFLDAYIEDKGYKSKNHKVAMERWVFDAIKERGHGNNRASPKSPEQKFNPTDYLLQQIYEEEEALKHEQNSS